jgi:hypothetical protein
MSAATATVRPIGNRRTANERKGNRATIIEKVLARWGEALRFDLNARHYEHFPDNFGQRQSRRMNSAAAEMQGTFQLQRCQPSAHGRIDFRRSKIID